MLGHFGGERMLNVPRVRRRLKAVRWPAPPAGPPLRQATPASGAIATASAAADFSSFTEPDLPASLIPQRPRRRSSRTKLLGTHGLVAVLVCMSQVAVQEAPAWGLSMVVHMVTLVTMAMVAIPDTVPSKTKHIIVAPPEQQQVEEVQDFSDKQPLTLDDTSEAEIVAFDSLDSNVGQEAAALDLSDDSLGTPAAMERRSPDQDSVPEIDALAMMHVYGNAYSDRGMSGNVQDIKREGGSEASERCVINALKWLASHQMPDGGWSFDLTACPSCRGQCRDSGKLGQARNAATGLALLPFLGSGYTHKDQQEIRDHDP